MTTWLKQSTAATVKLGPFVDETDGKTAEVGLAIAQADIRLSKNGGDIAQTNNATGATHDELGYYDIPLDTTDTNTLGRLRVLVSKAGALPVWADFMVVPANVWDSLFGADRLQVHADEITAGLITAAAIATGAIDADAIAADAVTELQSGLAVEATLTAIKGAGWSNETLAAIKLDTGVMLPNSLALLATGAAVSDLPTNAELATALAGADDAVLAAVAGVNTLVLDVPTNAELTTALGTADDAVLAAIAALNNLSAAQINAEVVDALRVDTLPDSYAADGAQPTMAQALLMIWAYLAERSVNGTTVTVRKPDGATGVMTFTLSDATNPVSITRAS